ncbi:blast:Transcription intermediary factor 1-alpha [Mytilus galloprovincialis]|uniref:Blast:Transcription intermediary factor 1-alpha n=1 Tax=Mytilus galloprovincialis TaxID=29158 RepID=A0A8B6CIX0_MYTGA|nr:blast:Transcription intermediary factor 1-alpha [Mytilus galloprovincialis]
MAQSASKSCDICMSGPGRNICEQCDQWMCENCKTLHLRSKISRNHTFLNGSNINPEDEPFCKEHDENFIFYCVECEMPICKICSVKKHKKHDMSEINESTNELQAEVKQVIDSKIKSIKTNLNKIEKGTGMYQSEIKEAIRVITEDGKQMKQWIDQKVQALIGGKRDSKPEVLSIN